MANNVYGTFVSQKVNKVRWKPNSGCDSFITGSWDDQANQIAFWKYTKTDYEDALVKPKKQCFINYNGDVMELKFLNYETFVASSSAGSVNIYSISEANDTAMFREVSAWNKVHMYLNGSTCACTDFALFDDTIVSVGEDGRIVLISVKENEPYRVIDNADSSMIRCVTMNKLNEVLTGNSRGQMKVWDLRSYSNEPETSLSLGEQIGFTRIIHHPTQTHIKLSGSEDGTVSVWDLRNNKMAINSMNAHSETVTELMFHPERPEHLFTTSENGQLWHWDSSKPVHNRLNQFPALEPDIIDDTGCPWMSKNVKNRLTIYSLIQNLHLPINTVDVQNNSVICGCDNEAVYLIKDFTAL